MSTLPMDDGTLHADYTQDGAVTVAFETWVHRNRPPGALVLPGLPLREVGPVGLTWLKVLAPSSAASRAHDLVLRLEPEQPDISVLASTSEGWQAVLGQGSPGIGEYVLPQPLPLPPDTYDLVIAASAYPRKATFRVVLEHRSAGNRIPGRGDSGTFTVAPYVLLSNEQPVEKVYVWYRLEDNHPTVADLAEALDAALGRGRMTLRPQEMPFQPGNWGALELIDGSQYAQDAWVQDQFEIGYRWVGSGRFQHVALLNPRPRPLAEWVRQTLPTLCLGVLDVGDQPLEDSTDYGGNLECSPQNQDVSYGRILLGESELPLFSLPADHAADIAAGIVSPGLAAEFKDKGLTLTTASITEEDGEWHLSDSPAPTRRRQFRIAPTGDRFAVSYLRSVEPDYRRFLVAQSVQPILSVDTSWLKVGHVDEIISVAPKGRLLIASSELAVNLLTAARSRRPTTMFRGREMQDTGFAFSDGMTVADALKDHEDFNRSLQKLKLNSIEERLKEGLGLADADLIRLPVLYVGLPDIGAWLFGVVDDLRTIALSPSLVNLLVVGDHIILPRPYGPRLRPDDVQAVTGARPPDRLLGHWHWERSGTHVSVLANRFNVSAEAILENHRNQGSIFDGGHTTFAVWTRIWIPEENVDLFEALAVLELESRSLLVHFVDTWAYHRLQGELHCATNVRRTPPTKTPEGWGLP